MTESTIIYTHTDEAPALATYSFLPVIQAYASTAGVTVETRDISLAERIIASFPDHLEEGQRIHDALACDALHWREPFEYHPHVTLAQDLKSDELDELVAVARARWAEFTGSKTFRVEKAIFVQNTRCNEWIDLGECLLGRATSEVHSQLTDLLAK